MPEIAFLLGDVRQARHDNHQRLPAAFERAGWQVARLSQEAVSLTSGGVTLADRSAADFDLVWMLGLGPLESFLDRMQLLRLLPQEQLVLCADALTYWHAKYAWWQHMPETHASGDAGHLQAVMARGGDWVVKPSAGSFGREVRRIRDDPAGRQALRNATRGGRYCLLQRYVAGIEQGEKRTLVAGGRLIGSYLRQPDRDLRANLAAGATAHPTVLEAGERQLVETLAADLAERGVGFAAVDVVFPYLMEVNLANPGGLAALEALYGEDPGDRVVAAIEQWWRLRAAAPGREAGVLHGGQGPRKN